MDISEIIASIDSEIGKLRSVRAALSDYSGSSLVKRSPGRPKKLIVSPLKTTAKRTMSAEGKARIAAAQKGRYAASKNVTK